MSRDDGVELVRRTYMIPKSLDTALGEAVDQAPEWINLSKSELLRYVVHDGVVESIDADDEVLELLPESILAKYLTNARNERRKARSWIIDMRGGWRGRVKSYCNARLAGDEPYHPDVVERLATEYWDELLDYDARLDNPPGWSQTRLRDWLDDLLDGYRDAFEAKQILPDDQPFSEVDDKIDVGRDLFRLQGQIADVVDDLAERAEAAQFDSDATVRAIAREYGVSEQSVNVILDVLLPDDRNPRDAIRELQHVDIEELIRDDAVKQVDDRPPVEGEIVAGVADGGVGDMASTGLRIQVDDVDQLPGGGDRLDPDRIEEIVDEDLRANGHRTANTNGRTSAEEADD